MKSNTFNCIGIILATIILTIPANAKGPKILNDVENTVKQAESVQDSVNTFRIKTANKSADTINISSDEDNVSAFLEYCAQNSNYDCECILKSYSDSIREEKERKLQELEESVDKKRKEILSNPRIATVDINAVCKLYDAAIEKRELSQIANAIGDSEEKSRLNLESKDLMNQSHELADSYVNENNPLTRGTYPYCGLQNELNQIKKDLAEDNGILYPAVIRQLTLLSLKSKEDPLKDTVTDENVTYAPFLHRVLRYKNECARLE